MHEAQSHELNSYLTLTYDDFSLPVDGSLQPKDFVDFMKRLRKKLEPERVRYYQCGEYGDDNLRPHHHCCLFGHDFSADRVFLKSTPQGHRLYRSEELEDSWGKGHVWIGDLTFQSAGYVARYCFKKQKYGERADDHYGGRKPEYSTMSRRPGIGKTWFDKHGDQVFPRDEVISNGHPSRPPKYYESLVPKDQLVEVKAHRVVAAERYKDDQTFDRLVTREKVKLAQVKSLDRG